MGTSVTEYVAQQLTRSVDHSGLTSERGHRRHVADDLDDSCHRGEVADLRLYRSDCVESTDPGQLFGPLGCDLRADLARLAQLAVNHRQLARGVDVRPGANRWHVGRDGLRPRGPGQSELDHALFGSHDLALFR